jgi:signal transduction histidine kinase
LTRRNLVLISTFPFIAIIYIFFLTGGPLSLVPVDFIVGESVTVTYNFFGRMMAGYFILLTLVNLIVLAWLFIRSPQLRWVVVLMAASQVVARVVVLGNEPSVGAQLFNIPMIALPYIPYAIALFGLGIFDPVPLARQIAIDQMLTGIVVLDSQERVANMNPAAEQILDTTSSRARGQPVREMLPAYTVGSQADPLGTQIEFELGSGTELRFYTLSSSPLKDFRELEVGRLLLLNDVTEQKQARAQILEQQRVMAIQNERERVARELHDSLGQVLSYTSFQVESAAKLSRDGQGKDAAEQLDRLGSVVREAHADLREVILNLHSTASLQEPFFSVVKQYLDAFTISYDIQTQLSVDPGLDERSIMPETQLQLFRILQEALSNARKHGRACQVQVNFAVDGGCLCMSIQDDGCGFTPDQLAKSGDGHYGLRFMQDRAAQLGGYFQINSALGKGTRVLLEVPL